MTVALTFDDGPGPSTEPLLDVLAAAGVRATFFLLGRNIEALPEVAVRVAREGHVLGNHTYSHARVIAADELVDEIARTDRLLAEIATRAGRVPATPPVRLPYGTLPDDARPAVLDGIGRPHVGWTADFEDWTARDPELLAAAMIAHVRAQQARGADAVLDLHDSSRRLDRRDVTVEGVRRLIAEVGAAAFR